ncbi:MAG: hypothetical protein CL512_04915 [Actinobacteria bacterium]|nr:hypothetical protein [Actinomycetota bacterium]
MEYLKILNIILALLQWNGAPTSDLSKPHIISHMNEVAKAISDAPINYQVRLIALGYEESRFGFQHVLKGRVLRVKSSGACGIFQQLPKYALGGKTTCDRLQDPKEAVKQALAYLKMIEKRFKPRHKGKGELKMDRAMCHYFSGNRCDRSARKYSARHRATRLKTLRVWREWK